MSKSLYITSLEPGGGKTVAALGFMEQLSGYLRNIAVFRPVIYEEGITDRVIRLMTDRYNLPFSTFDQSGIGIEEALSLMAADKEDELYSRILEKYKSLE